MLGAWLVSAQAVEARLERKRSEPAEFLIRKGTEWGKLHLIVNFEQKSY